MTDQRNQNVTPSHIDIGGVALPREALLDVLPDVDRFERHLADALRVDHDMKEGDGSIPAYVRDWSQARIDGVIATLKEVGSLREQASEQIGARALRRKPSV